VRSLKQQRNFTDDENANTPKLLQGTATEAWWLSDGRKFSATKHQYID